MILAFSDEEDNSLNAITRALADKTEILSVEPEELFSLAFIGIEIFPKERKVKIGREEVKFSRFEFDILLFLAYCFLQSILDRCLRGNRSMRQSGMTSL